MIDPPSVCIRGRIWRHRFRLANRKYGTRVWSSFLILPSFPFSLFFFYLFKNTEINFWSWSYGGRTVIYFDERCTKRPSIHLTSEYDIHPNRHWRLRSIFRSFTSAWMKREKQVFIQSITSSGTCFYSIHSVFIRFFIIEWNGNTTNWHWWLLSFIIIIFFCFPIHKNLMI